MLVHVVREYNLNRIFLSCLGLWPFQSKLARNCLPIFCLVLQISYYPFEILLLYDHSDDAQMVFESCYQIVITNAFLVRLWNEMWNRKKIVYVLDQMDEMFRFACIIMGALLQLMIMCYSGQKLIDESQNMFHRAYTAEWYTFSPRLKTLMIITFYRSVVPCTLTAGKMLPLSMSTYAAVVRAGMSYFTAFLSLKD